MEKFNAAEIFSKSGMQFSEIHELLNNLVRKGYFTKEKTDYDIGEELKIFTNLDKQATNEKCDFLGVNYDEKLKPKYNIEEIVNFLGKFVNIKSYRECWLME